MIQGDRDDHKFRRGKPYNVRDPIEHRFFLFFQFYVGERLTFISRIWTLTMKYQLNIQLSFSRYSDLRILIGSNVISRSKLILSIFVAA